MFGAAMVGAFAVERLASGAGAAACAAAALGAASVAVLRRRVASAIVVGAVVVGVCALAGGVHAATGRGFLSWHGLSAVGGSLRSARAPLSAFHLPLVHTPGMVVLCSLVAGLSAVAGRALGTRFPVLSLVPAGGLLVSSSILLPATGAALGGLLLGGCGFLVIGGQPHVLRRTLVVVAAVLIGPPPWPCCGRRTGPVRGR